MSQFESEHRNAIRRIEEASLNAWPAMHQTLLDGWLLRFSHGFTKRANSIVPLYPGFEPIEAKVRHCENIYARERLQTIFRLTTATNCEALDEYLDHRAYQRADPTEVLTASLDGHQALSPQAMRLLSREDWLAVYSSLTSMPEPAQQLHGAILKGIQSACAYAVIDSPEGPMACGLAVVEQHLGGLFDIYTHADHRGRGHAESLVRQLMHWSEQSGARTVYLQMVASNEPARRLYQKLNFSRRYDYWYRIRG